MGSLRRIFMMKSPNLVYCSFMIAPPFLTLIAPPCVSMAPIKVLVNIWCSFDGKFKILCFDNRRIGKGWSTSSITNPSGLLKFLNYINIALDIAFD